MWRRFVTRHMFLNIQQNTSFSCSVFLLRMPVSHSSTSAKDVSNSLRQKDADVQTCSSPLPGRVGPEELAEEVKATRDEARLMEAHTPPVLGAAAGDWAEPALEDLDRSIPQVDCRFIADLIRFRTVRRKEFLEKKAKVSAKVVALKKQQARSVHEAARLPVVSVCRGGSSEDNDAFVTASPEVLAQLTDDEREALLTLRPEYNDGFVLLDCRTVNEVTSWGMIEGAKLLPAHEMFDGFHLTPEEFETEFGFEKPRPEQKIICYCQYGPRSLMAAQILSWMGYTNVLHFRDGYYEWGKQYNLLLRRWMLHDKETGNESKRQAAFQAGLELQREIAPEFNDLPMKEAAQYKIDTTRSRGKLLVGEGVREEACNEVAKLVCGMHPTLLPGVLDVEERVVGTEGGGGGVDGNREKYFQQFLEESAGVNTRNVDTRPPMGLAEAQEKIMDAFTRRDGSSHIPKI